MPSCLNIVPAIIAMALLTQATTQATTLGPQEQAIASQLLHDPGQKRTRSEMKLDPVLTAVARGRAEDMATRRYFSHVTPDGHGPNQLMRAAGYALPSSWGMNRSDNYVESIGAGYETAEAAWRAWMRSSSHRTHLLAGKSFYRSQTRFGVGYHSDPSSPYRRYWVVITAPPAQKFTVSSTLRADRFAEIRIGVQIPSGSASSKSFRPVASRPASHHRGTMRSVRTL